MKKRSKIVVYFLLIALLISFVPITAFAASYPLIMVDTTQSSSTIVKGETGTIRFTIMPEYHNEKYHVMVYDSNGQKIASSESSYYNTDGTSVRYVNISIDTADLNMSVGTYKVEYWLSFYSLQSWHDAPNKYTYTFQVVPYVCSGAHVYDASCDAECNVCGETRSVNHSYSASCDASCNVCGYTRSTSASHTYSNSADKDCNNCGYERLAIQEDTSATLYSGTCGANVNWKITQNGTLVISGSGNMYSYSGTDTPWGDYSVRNKIVKIQILPGVTSIGNDAFYFCTKVETAEIAETVKFLGEGCFNNCTSMRSVNIPDGVRAIPEFAFDDCSSLQEIVIPKTVTAFGQNCFDGCSSLTYFIVPDGVTEISYGMFDGASMLQYIQIPASVKEVGTSAFYNCYLLTDIYYGGSSSQFKAITVKGNYNTAFKNANVHYNSKAPCVTCTYGGWTYANENSHKSSCTNCGDTKTQSHTWDAGVVTKKPTESEDGTKKYTCTICKGSKTVVWTYEEFMQSVTRVFGGDRYYTAFKAADTLKDVLGVQKFQNVIVASGTGFADALAGSYLASVKDAPILLVREANVNAVKDYIKKNLASGGTVYLLGGVNAVPKTMETGLDGFKVKRLGGATRYDTNLQILKEAGVEGKDIIICTGKNFADSLSASAAGLPILLVKDSLSANQKQFLAGTSGKKIIVGGTGAVNKAVESQLQTYGEVKRLAGNTRYDTSVLVAKEFFKNPKTIVLAYAQNFPDGLSGGALAYALNAPLILTDSKKPTAAVKYGTELGIKNGYVLGGTGLISDKVVKNIFSMTATDQIIVK